MPTYSYSTRQVEAALLPLAMLRDAPRCSAMLRDAARLGAAPVENGVDVYPNPAAGRASVRVSVAEAAERASVTVYDALGRRVSVLHDGPLAMGAHALPFDATALPAGVYVVQVRVASEAGGSWMEVRRVSVAR